MATTFTSLCFFHHHHCHHRFTSQVCSSHSHKSSFINRRSLFLLSTSLHPLFLPSTASIALDSASSTVKQNVSELDTTITDRIFMDFSICPTYTRSDRTISDDLATCPDSELLGRIVLGLYGKLVPRTVSNFKAMCSGSAGSTYKGSLIQKIFQGQYFMAGKQGRRDKGEVDPPLKLESNVETVDSRAFMLRHSRPGTLSLCLSENDDEDDIKLNPNYRNTEFLITTGPGPCPQLDSKNIVFGTVLEGMDVVTGMATIPTYVPAERIRQFNVFAQFLGDERAQNARTSWNRPLRAVYISDCGELEVVSPSLSPTLP